MNIKTIPIEDIKEAKYNPRLDLKPSDEEYQKIKRSILEFGFVEPLVWNSHNYVLIGGHQRLKILKELNYKEIPVSAVEITDERKEKALNIALNKVQGDWDNKKLIELLNDLNVDGFDLTLTGFNTDELEELINYNLNGYDDSKDDEVPDPPDDPITKTGDLYQLGNHRLLCGDSTKKDDVERLMDGQKADLIVTDPPYGVNYQKKDGQNRKITGDESIEVAKEIWSKAFENYHLSTKEGASYYSFSCQGGDQMMMMMMVSQKWQVKHELMWVKDSFVFGRCDYKYQHEPIIYGWKKGETHQFYGDAKQSSVLNYPRKKENVNHPTVKPVLLLMQLVGNSSKAGDIVTDLFLGSGSTLIACEKSNRNCYGMEIDPIYCDVIVKRWEEYTGQKAELINDGKKTLSKV